MRPPRLSAQMRGFRRRDSYLFTPGNARAACGFRQTHQGLRHRFQTPDCLPVLLSTTALLNAWHAPGAIARREVFRTVETGPAAYALPPHRPVFSKYGTIFDTLDRK